MAHRLGALFEITSSKRVSSPTEAHQECPPTTVELDQFEWGDRLNGPADAHLKPSGAVLDTSGPTTSNDLEMSVPAPARSEDATSLIQTWSNPPMNTWRVLSCCLIYFGNGLNDSAPGALIPYMEKHYSIGYALVSSIFITNAVGFISAAFFVEMCLGRFGRAKSLAIAEALMIAGYILMVCNLPFGIIIASFLFLGFGYGVNLALNNVFCANLAGSTVVLGAAHGSYGVGGTIGPIIATTLASRGFLWSRFYVITIIIKFLGLLFASWTFKNYEEEAPRESLVHPETAGDNRPVQTTGALSKSQLLWRAVGNRVTMLGALFIFSYQGAEVSISGWLISFLISYRKGNPAQVGYVTAGFWGGITIGRFFLSPLGHRYGEKLCVYVLGVTAAAFQVLVWLIPNVIGNAIAVSIVGLLLGPVYPCAQTIFTRLLPRRTQTTAVGFISSAGSSGGAVAPFTTGLLAQAAGTFVLHPICIGLFGIMLLSWSGLPRVHKRRD